MEKTVHQTAMLIHSSIVRSFVLLQIVRQSIAGRRNKTRRWIRSLTASGNEGIRLDRVGEKPLKECELKTITRINRLY